MLLRLFFGLFNLTMQYNKSWRKGIEYLPFYLWSLSWIRISFWALAFSAKLTKFKKVVLVSLSMDRSPKNTKKFLEASSWRQGKLQWDCDPFKPTLESSSKSLALPSATFNIDNSLSQLSKINSINFISTNLPLWAAPSSVEAESSEVTSPFWGEETFFSSFWMKVWAFPWDWYQTLVCPRMNANVDLHWIKLKYNKNLTSQWLS